MPRKTAKSEINLEELTPTALGAYHAYMAQGHRELDAFRAARDGLTLRSPRQGIRPKSFATIGGAPEFGDAGRANGVKDRRERFRPAIVRELQRHPERLMNIVHALLDACEAGNMKAITIFAERVDGKVPIKQEIRSERVDALEDALAEMPDDKLFMIIDGAPTP